MINTINSTTFLQDRLTPLDRIIAGTILSNEIAVGAQNSIQIGNIGAMGDVTMNANAHGIFTAAAFVKAAAGTQITPSGNNGILLTINRLCDGLFFTSEIPNEDRFTPAHPVSRASFMEVFPNPFSDQIRVRVQLPKAMAGSLQLFDLSGKLLQSLNCQSLTESGSLEATLELADLHAGIYFLRLQHEDGIQTTKLVKVD
jgi:hypothetical protein